MNKFLVLAACICVFAGCSQQRYGFRKTIPAHRDLARTETHKPATKAEAEQGIMHDEKSPAADTLATAKAETPKPAAKQSLKEITSAGIATFKEIIPFHPEQLSPEEKHADAHAAQPSAGGSVPIMPLLAFVFALLSVFMLLLVIFVSSYTIGIILLFAAPVFAALGLILGLTSISDHDGKDLAMAAIIISGIVLLIMLIVLMVSYLFLQSRNK